MVLTVNPVLGVGNPSANRLRYDKGKLTHVSIIDSELQRYLLNCFDVAPLSFFDTTL